MSLAVIDLNAMKGFLADANVAFQASEGITYDTCLGDRQGCLNSFVLELVKRFREAGALDPMGERPERE